MAHPVVTWRRPAPNGVDPFAMQRLPVDGSWWKLHGNRASLDVKRRVPR